MNREFRNDGLIRNAGFQTCRIADFQVGCAFREPGSEFGVRSSEFGALFASRLALCQVQGHHASSTDIFPLHEPGSRRREETHSWTSRCGCEISVS